MGWSTYDVTDGTLNNSNRANAGSADFSRTQLRGGGLDDTKLEDEQKKRRVSEVTLMLWGIFDLVALVSLNTNVHERIILLLGA